MEWQRKHIYHILLTLDLGGICNNSKRWNHTLNIIPFKDLIIFYNQWLICCTWFEPFLLLLLCVGSSTIMYFLEKTLLSLQQGCSSKHLPLPNIMVSSKENNLCHESRTPGCCGCFSIQTSWKVVPIQWQPPIDHI